MNQRKVLFFIPFSVLVLALSFCNTACANTNETPHQSNDTIIVPIVVTDEVGEVKTDSQCIEIKDITNEVSYGHNPEAKPNVDVIVLHSCYHADSPDTFSIEGVIKQFIQYDVASHYLIARDGLILRLVSEDHVAWHAGKSALPTTKRTGLNATSIGIETICSKWNGPTEEQYTALAGLVNDICERYEINYIVSHEDIAPTRRSDPWCFNWNRFKAKLSEKALFAISKRDRFPKPKLTEKQRRTRM